MINPEQHAENSGYPLENTSVDRRTFLREALTAGIAFGVSGCLDSRNASKKEEAREGHESTTWTPERRAEIFEKERGHEFFRLATPERKRQWLEANAGPMCCPEDDELQFDILCPDDRIRLKPDEFAWRIGGAGILYAFDDERGELDYRKALALLGPHRRKIRGIKNHRCNCVACKIVAKKLALTGTPQDGDTLGQQWAKELADRLGVPYLGEADMEQQYADGHPGSAILYGSKRAQASQNIGFHSLVIHRWGNDHAHYARKELRSAADNIVLDPGQGIGIGPRFINRHRPALILASGANVDEMRIAAGEAEEVAKELNTRRGDELLKVVPYIAPRAV